MSLKVGELVALLRLDDGQFSQALNTAEQGLQGAGKKMTDMGKQLSMKVTAPIVGLGTAAVMAVSDFDDSMSRVQAISGATGDDLGELRDMAKELGSTTAHSASAAADAMSYLALAGWDTNQILAATPDMLSLASAAGMDLARAADIVSDTMSAFSMEAERAGEAADIFAAASSESNTDVEQLGEAMKYAGAAANAAGMDLAQTSAVLGVLADSGIKGSQGGTTFNAMLRDMKKAAEDGSLAVGDMDIALYNADGTMRDMGAVMADVEEATKDMTTQQRDAAMGAMFGEQALKGVNVMLATGADRYNELEDAIYNSGGAASEMADVMEDNVGGALRALKSAAEGLAISFGEVLAPYIAKVAEFLANLGQRFSNLDERTKKIIVVVAAVVAAIGPLLIVIGTLLKVGGTIITAIKGIGTAFSFVMGIVPKLVAGLKILASVIAFLLSPIGLVIAAVVALVAIGVYLWKNWEEVSEKLTEIWDGIKQFAEDAFTALKDFLTETWESIKETANEVWQGMSEAITEVFTAIQDFFTETWEAIKETIFGVWENIREGAVNVFESVKNFFVGIWENIRNTAVEMWARISDGIRERATAIKDSIINTVNSALEFIRELPAKAFEWGKNIIQGLINGVRNMASNLGGAIRDVASNAVKSVTNFLGISSPSKVFEDIGLNVGRGMEQGILKAENAVQSAMEEMSAPTTAQSTKSNQPPPKEKHPGSEKGGAGGKSTSITINNPVAEKGSDSIRKELLRLSHMGVEV